MMSRGAHFHEEARRLLEEEDGLHVRLATIQGLATLFSRWVSYRFKSVLCMRVGVV